MALSHLRHAPLALRLARLPPLACSSHAARRLLLFAPARPWRLLSTASRPRSLATVAAAEADDASAGADGFFAEDSTTWRSLGISDRLASALQGTGLARPSLVQVTSALLASAQCVFDEMPEPGCNVLYLFSIRCSVGRLNYMSVLI
jgi:hypothetical protein